MSSPSSADSVPLINYRGHLLSRASRDGKYYRKQVSFNGSSLMIAGEAQDSQDIEIINLPRHYEVNVITHSKEMKFVIHSPSLAPIEFVAETQEELNRWALMLKAHLAPPPDLSMEDFNILSVIGRGYYGKVMLAQHKATGELFAIKSIRKARLQQISSFRTVISERNMLMKVHHPFIVTLYFAFQTDSKFYIGLEYAAGGELFYHMQKYGVINCQDIKLYVAEIALALQHLHSMGIIYRDLKPENILLDSEGHIKLTDFGLAKELSLGEQASTFCGTSEYLAPEVIMRHAYGKEVDIWALGILAYEMMFGVTPFFDENRSTMFEKICFKEVILPDGIDDPTKEFFQRLLEKDPKKRITLDQMKELKYFQGLSFELVYERMVPPSYIPETNDPRKPNNFDKAFTSENAVDSFASPPMSGDQHIQGFSYVDPKIEYE